MSRWPRMSFTFASSAAAASRRRHAGRESGDRERTERRRRAPLPRPGIRSPPTGALEPSANLEARPAPTSASKHSLHSSRGCATTSERSRSWSSSASRTSGVASARTRSIAVGVEPAELPRLHRQAAAQRHRARAALGDLGVLVEESERRAVQDLVSEHARLDGVEEVEADAVLLEPPHQRLEARRCPSPR